MAESLRSSAYEPRENCRLGLRETTSIFKNMRVPSPVAPEKQSCLALAMRIPRILVVGQIIEDTVIDGVEFNQGSWPDKDTNTAKDGYITHHTYSTSMKYLLQLA